MFPRDFLWGVATASYQIEGATQKDGRGESIWDRFAHTPGKVVNGDTGDVACDHYHRYPEDINLMTQLGARAYRFSIAWPRILPEGKNRINEAGLAFYDRLVDTICAAGLMPFATLYHWDLPQALQDEGGWLNRATADHFAAYTDHITRRLGDRVKFWATFNEPLCIAILGYHLGIHAPGMVDPTGRALCHVSHHVNLAHGKAVPVIRANVPDAQVGIVLNMWQVHPATDSEADRQAATLCDGIENRWFADPVLKGSYPADILAQREGLMPEIGPDDMRLMSAPLDFFGLNHYERKVVRAGNTPDMPYETVKPEGSEYTAMDWEVYPDGLREILVRIHRDYGPKAMYVTENGCAYNDVPDADGEVRDTGRVNFLKGYIGAVAQAIAEGAPVKGYFVWSFMDNFEWAFGYTKRFGIVYVDYATQRRTPKASYHYYANVIRQNGV